jgi:four helix bundle protein
LKDEMLYARSFRDLVVYRKAFDIAQRLFVISSSFPREEKYSLTDQVRRSSRSVGAQIAEAWGKRKYEKHFVSKLTDADAEQLETQHWVAIAASSGYLKKSDHDELQDELSRVGRMLHSMITKSGTFCREDPPSYDKTS